MPKLAAKANAKAAPRATKAVKATGGSVKRKAAPFGDGGADNEDDDEDADLIRALDRAPKVAAEDSESGSDLDDETDGMEPVSVIIERMLREKQQAAQKRRQTEPVAKKTKVVADADAAADAADLLPAALLANIESQRQVKQQEQKTARRRQRPVKSAAPEAKPAPVVVPSLSRPTTKAGFALVVHRPSTAVEAANLDATPATRLVAFQHQQLTARGRRVPAALATGAKAVRSPQPAAMFARKK